MKIPAVLSNRRIAWLRAIITLLLLLPAGLYIFALLTDRLGANPIEALIRGLGDWTMRMLLLSLAVTPLRRVTGWLWVIRLRRRVGLIAYAYVLLHLFAYIGLDQFFDWPQIAEELIKRNFILIGLGAVVILTALAVTSTDAAMRRLGARWKPLHRLSYLAAILALVHYLMAVKANIWPPLGHGAVLAGLLVMRIKLK